MKLKDLTNQKFDKLKVLRYSHIDKYGHRYWICECTCGKIYPVKGSHLTHDKLGSCGCYKIAAYKEISGGYWGNVQRSAKRKGLEFNLTIEYAWNMFTQQNRRCSLTGRELCFVKNWQHNCTKQTASLDRIDSKIGYLPTNVCWLHKDINMFKGNMHSRDFIALCQEVINFQNELLTGMSGHDRIVPEVNHVHPLH
jgi:hypothetical protein